MTSECPECRAIEDAKYLFVALEQIGKRDGIDPDRMLKALREVLAAWATVLWKAYPEDIGDIEDEADRLAEMTARSIHHAIRDEQGHMH